MPPTKQELRDGFVEDIYKIYNLYNSLSGHATKVENMVLAEQTIVSITVALESFISDLLVSLISERPDLYLNTLTQGMKDALLKAGYSHPTIRYLAHEGMKKLSNDEIREIILDDGDNLAFPETRRLREFIKNNLPPDAIFEITVEEEVFVDLLKSTRNLCAHHSQKAARTLNGKHKNHFHNPKVKDSFVCRALVQEEDIAARTVGDYLRQQPPDHANMDRIGFFVHYLREMVFRWIK